MGTEVPSKILETADQLVQDAPTNLNATVVSWKTPLRKVDSQPTSQLRFMSKISRSPTSSRSVDDTVSQRERRDGIG